MNNEDRRPLMAKILAKTAKEAAKATANSRCVYVFHQPEVPTDVKTLRKF